MKHIFFMKVYFNNHIVINFTSRKKVGSSGYETKHYSTSVSCVRIDVVDQSAKYKKIIA